MRPTATAGWFFAYHNPLLFLESRLKFDVMKPGIRGDDDDEKPHNCCVAADDSFYQFCSARETKPMVCKPSVLAAFKPLPKLKYGCPRTLMSMTRRS